MQAARACQILPTKLQTTASPPKLPPTYTTQQPKKLPRALSITAPPPELTTTIQENKTDEDAVAAFWDYQFLFVSQRAETFEPVTLRLVDGAFPHDLLSGTYYLTGPGIFSDDHGSTVHPLDGHGYLRAFSFDAGRRRVEFMARYIETEAQAEERDPSTGEWRFTHRGPFSVLKGGKMMGNTKVMKNVANTSVLRWGGRLFCLWEGGDPYEIEAPTLDTLGSFNVFGGGEMPPVNDEGRRFTADFLDVAAQILKPVLHGVFKMTPKRLLSHYKIDTKRNRLLIMSCNAEDMLLPRSNFTFYEFDGDFKLVQSQEFSIPDHLMIHDWAFTDSHYILFGNRIKLDVAGSMAAVCGLSPMISALTLNPSKPTSPIYLLPRFSDAQPNRLRDWRIPIEAPSQMWVLHVGNAFEDRGKDGNLNIQIQASGCSYRWFNFQKMFGYDWQSGKLDPSMMNPTEGQQKLLPHLVQVNISMDKNGKCVNCDTSELSDWDRPSDFPVINQDFSGKKNRYVYAATSSGRRQALPHFPFDTVVKLDTTDRSSYTWSTGRRRFIGEPIFISRGNDGNEDGGYVLVVEYAVSTQRCYLVVLDSTLIGKHNALVARFEVPRHLNFPLGFHGFWAPN
ncbi:carotenoid cleavage dioxygenase 7, chloroplastic-like [Dorcoceras hygrometricum]|uniref:Carotenoid cleavage dioxygenase 7, chloroplastic-like n=1 Tax=Dorcoceras hygrometricum TaxID=472368 RepID=A0A2Z7C411_9LAMI|nr:carotenoid cleavage dioxygenase 7, chloroplastic-like [Dorcoceras hygrometricum]